jgi:hypothetical protein
MASIHITSAQEDVTKVYGFNATGYFHKGEMIYVTIRASQQWGHVIPPDGVTVFLNVSFNASDGGSINLVACYDAEPSTGGYGMTAPSLELINVSVITSTIDAPLSAASARALAEGGYLGGTVQRDGNLTVALDGQSVFNNFMSHDPPLITLRKTEPIFLYSYLSPFGLVSVVLGVTLLVFGWRKRERRRYK